MDLALEAMPMDELLDTLEYLRGQTIDAVMAEWRRQLGTGPPRLRSRDVLVYLLAWRLQEREHNGLSASVKYRLRRLERERQTPSDAPRRIRREALPGTVLAREWKGATHHVAVTTTGFEYAGRCYRSLSEVARAITGTRWSGPVFFGLRQPGARRTTP